MKHLYTYASPTSLNFNWGFGSALGIFMTFQVVIGLLISMFYHPVRSAFSEVIYLVNEVAGGYLLKYLHLNGASVIFILLYLHIIKALFYGSFRTLAYVWASGIAIFVLSILTAFLGYSLPYGQMSYWAATVITNLLTVIPVLGERILIGLHGAFAVQEQTISRFFVLHFLLAIVVLLLALVHILILHANGSTSPEVRNSGWSGQGGFAYFFVFKDMQIVVVAFLVLFYLSLIIPNYLNHSDNFIEANPLVTPTHIVPEWYFLTFYAMLRAVPNKLGGAGVLALSLLFLAILPALARGYSRYELTFSDYRGPSAPFVAIFVFLSALLGYLGAQEAVEPFIVCSQLACLHYFMVLLFRIAAYPAHVGVGFHGIKFSFPAVLIVLGLLLLRSIVCSEGDNGEKINDSSVVKKKDAGEEAAATTSTGAPRRGIAPVSDSDAFPTDDEEMVFDGPHADTAERWKEELPSFFSESEADEEEYVPLSESMIRVAKDAGLYYEDALGRGRIQSGPCTPADEAKLEEAIRLYLSRQELKRLAGLLPDDSKTSSVPIENVGIPANSAESDFVYTNGSLPGSSNESDKLK